MTALNDIGRDTGGENSESDIDGLDDEDNHLTPYSVRYSSFFTCVSFACNLNVISSVSSLYYQG